MEKNITSILQRGNIKPSDRVKLLVADDVSRERDKKALLTEADKHALREGWTPKNNNEVKEYNLYNEGRRNIAFGELDAQTTYLQLANSFLRTRIYLGYILDKDYAKKDKSIKELMADEVFKSLLKKVDEAKALNLVLEYSGLEIDYTIYLYAFELAGEQLQKDLLALCPDAKTEHSYLEQEEIIYNLFNGKDKLSQTDKEKLAELIADECFNKYRGEWSFSGYFSDIPLIEVVKKWADDKSLDTLEGEELRKEKLTAYAKENKREIKDIITETILKWLNEGLLDEYVPLFKSDKKETCNGQDTKLTHKELFEKWLDVKAKATETIQGLIDKGELKTEEKIKTFGRFKKMIDVMLKSTIDFKGKTGQDKQDAPITEAKTIIAGKSLYNLKGDYQFIKDFKEQVEDFKICGALVLFLRECEFVKYYATLLGFLELFKKISKVFDADLTYKIQGYIKSFNEDLESIKIELLMLAEAITKADYKGDRVYYLRESYLEEMLIMPFDHDKIKPDTDTLKVYFDAFKQLFGDSF